MVGQSLLAFKSSLLLQFCPAELAERQRGRRGPNEAHKDSMPKLLLLSLFPFWGNLHTNVVLLDKHSPSSSIRTCCPLIQKPVAGPFKSISSPTCFPCSAMLRGKTILRNGGAKNNGRFWAGSLKGHLIKPKLHLPSRHSLTSYLQWL